MSTGLPTNPDQVMSWIAIKQLVARYCFAMDDHDVAETEAIFADDAVVRSPNGMDSTGRAAILEMYKGRWGNLGLSNHYTHDHVIRLDPTDPDRADGVVSCHAELWRNNQTMLVALRYHDRYVRERGEWKFAERSLSFLYYCPVSDYPTILGQDKRVFG